MPRLGLASELVHLVSVSSSEGVVLGLALARIVNASVSVFKVLVSTKKASHILAARRFGECCKLLHWGVCGKAPPNLILVCFESHSTDWVTAELINCRMLFLLLNKWKYHNGS